MTSKIHLLWHKASAIAPRKKSDGFTIVELIAAIAVTAVIAGLAAGGIHQWMVQRGLTTAVEQLRGDLQRAKLLAVKENTSCVVTINSPGANSYTISLNNQVVNLSRFLGNVTFTGPSTIVTPFTITPWGTCTAGEIHLTSLGNPALYRLRTTSSGGISKQIWNGAAWVGI